MDKIFFSKKYSMKNIILRYGLLLLPFIIYGIYKNGYLLYQKNIISIWSIFKIVYLIGISLIINVLFNIVLKKKINWDFGIIYALIIPLFMPYNISYLYYIIGYILGSIVNIFLSKIININKMNTTIVITLLLLIITHGLNYLNPLETQGIYSFNTIDLLLGRTYGGIGTTLIIYAFIFAIISSIVNNYKYTIPLVGIITYFIGSYLLVGFSYKTYTNSFVIMSIILLTVDSNSNPIKILPMVLYGFLWGSLMTFCTVYLGNPIWIFICQIVVNIFEQIIAKMSKKCYNMNDFLSKKTRGVYGLYK